MRRADTGSAGYGRVPAGGRQGSAGRRDGLPVVAPGQRRRRPPGGRRHRGPRSCARPRCRSATLSAITGADVWLKFENLQFTASFKDRGALNRLLQLDARTSGAAASWPCRPATTPRASPTTPPGSGIPATIVMPRSTPEREGGTAPRPSAPRVVLHGDDLGRGRAPRPTTSSSRGPGARAPLRRRRRHRRAGHGGPGAARGRARPRRARRARRRRRPPGRHGRGGAATCARTSS